MEIHYSKNFNKAFSKLTRKQQLKIDDTISVFRHNPQNLQLKNHALKDPLLGYHAIATGGNLRLIFQADSNYERVEFILVGTHTQVY